MSTALERLLASIDPERTLDEVASRSDEAFNSFRTDKAFLTRWEELEELGARFYCHMENRVNRLRPARQPDLRVDWPRFKSLLREEYGPSGDKLAFELARTGAKGGLYGVLKSVSRRLVDFWAGNEIAARVSLYWNRLTTDEMHGAATEYLRKYGNLLPPEITENDGLRIRVNFPKVLSEHPFLVKRMRQVGR